MGFLLTLIIIIFILNWALPRILRLLLPWLVQRQARRMTDNFARAAGFDPRTGARAGGNPAPEPPAKPAKKIDPNVGEYVRFEEINVEETTTTTTQGDTTTTETRIKIEDQVTDVEWEEV